MSSAPSDNKTHFLGILIWIIGALFFTYEFFLRTFIGSVAHQVIPDLHLNAETFSILGSAYYIAYALMQLPVGVLVDKFGVKLVLACATLICAVSTFYFAHAGGFGSAFISRILMGLGSAFAFVCLLVIVITWFPRKYFGSLAGISQFVGTMGPLLGGGPLIALMQSYHTSWRTTISSIAYVGLGLFACVILFVKSKRRDSEQKVLIFLQQDKPLLQRLAILLKNRQAWAIALYSAAIYISIALLGAIWGTEYLQARGLTQAHAADMISISWLGYAIGCPLLGAISDLTKRRKPTLIFCAIIGIISTTFIVFLATQSILIYGFLFFALGIAAAGQNVGFATIAEQVNLSTRATALGLNNGTIMLAGAFIPPIISYFINHAAKNPSHLVVSDFITGLSAMPFFYLISLIIAAFFVKETFCKPQKDMIFLNPEN